MPTLQRTENNVGLNRLSSLHPVLSSVALESLGWSRGPCHPVGAEDRPVTHSSCSPSAQRGSGWVSLENLFLSTPEASNPPPSAPEAPPCSSKNFPWGHLPPSASNLLMPGQASWVLATVSNFRAHLFSTLLPSFLPFALIFLPSLSPLSPSFLSFLPPSLSLPASLLPVDEWFAWPSEL